MKLQRSSQQMKVAGALLLLFGPFVTPAQAAHQDTIDAAWRQAVTLAGAPASGLRQPEVIAAGPGSGRDGHTLAEYVPFANEVLIYRTDRVPAAHLLVHEFLHAIYYQTHAETLTLAALAQEEPSEDWVRERMSAANRLD